MLRVQCDVCFVVAAVVVAVFGAVYFFIDLLCVEVDV